MEGEIYYNCAAKM
ncbi:hypothetical protein Avbf_17431 [Armadillidium vulgare]|nr:hypothetical protein Avbf_17431 [Armadillidium vulgare]